MNDPGILVINLGSTSTRVAFYQGVRMKWDDKKVHDPKELSVIENLWGQYDIRKNAVVELLEKHEDIKGLSISAIAARGAPLKPLKGGTYRINEKMLKDLKEGNVQSPHISMLCAPIAYELSRKFNIPSFIADPVSVDEFEPLARYTGLSEITRKSLWHSLNCRSSAIRAAKDIGKKYEELNMIVVHLGSGITVSCHKKGRCVDVNNANSEGPFSPERSGTLPVYELIELCFNGKYSKNELVKKISRTGGLMSYLGINDAKEIENVIINGEREEEKSRFREIYEAMAYQIAKEIGAMSTVLKGQVDLIVIGGALAHSKILVDWIMDRIDFISTVKVYPGENEMEALAFAVFGVIAEGNKEETYI